MSLEQPGIYAGLVAEQMKLSPSTITRLIEKLELNGWLFRHQDGKNTRLWPTDKAKDKHTRMIEIIQGFYSKYTELIGEEDSQQLVNLMNQLEAKL
jgi:DNA-binding MarR family transcriptional regulator